MLTDTGLLRRLLAKRQDILRSEVGASKYSASV